MRSPLFWDLTQLRLVVCYRRFGTTSRSNLQRSSSATRRVKHQEVSSRITWPLQMGSIGCHETSETNYHSTQPNITEERRYHLHGVGRWNYTNRDVMLSDQYGWSLPAARHVMKTDAAMWADQTGVGIAAESVERYRSDRRVPSYIRDLQLLTLIHKVFCITAEILPFILPSDTRGPLRNV